MMMGMGKAFNCRYRGLLRVRNCWLFSGQLMGLLLLNPSSCDRRSNSFHEICPQGDDEIPDPLGIDCQAAAAAFAALMSVVIKLEERRSGVNRNNHRRNERGKMNECRWCVPPVPHMYLPRGSFPRTGPIIEVPVVVIVYYLGREKAKLLVDSCSPQTFVEQPSGKLVPATQQQIWLRRTFFQCSSTARTLLLYYHPFTGGPSL